MFDLIGGIRYFVSAYFIFDPFKSSFESIYFRGNEFMMNDNIAASWPITFHLTNHISKLNKTCWALL